MSIFAVEYCLVSNTSEMIYHHGASLSKKLTADILICTQQERNKLNLM